jgi:hypothetical protein
MPKEWYAGLSLAHVRSYSVAVFRRILTLGSTEYDEENVRAQSEQVESESRNDLRSLVRQRLDHALVPRSP